MRVPVRLGFVLLLALLSATSIWYTATALIPHSRATTALAETAAIADVFTNANASGHHSFPIRSNTEERTIEELLEDFTENQNEAAGISHSATFSAERCDLSAEGGHYFSPSLTEALPPFYILFHSWKSFLS